MIRATDLLGLFEQMLREHWPYELGAARTGCVDCSGAFSYAFGQLGGSIPHGSNAIARMYVVELLPISEAKPCMAAFKAHPPGDPKWALPARYKGDKDQNDYYHVGLVGLDGKVLNAQSTQTGFVSSKISGWDFCARLKGVDYNGMTEEDMDGEISGRVVAENGGNVRMREQPSTSAKVVSMLKPGTMIDILEDLGPWMRIKCGSLRGYMMSNYVEYAGQPDETRADPDLVRIDLKEIIELRDLALKTYEGLNNIMERWAP